MRMWSITGVGLVGLLIKNSAESVPCKIVYFLRKRPITLSTWILTLEIFLVFSTSRGSSCFFPLVKAGITSSDLLKATLSCIVNPLSVMTMSPGTRISDEESSKMSSFTILPSTSSSCTLAAVSVKASSCLRFLRVFTRSDRAACSSRSFLIVS